jgi:hypothetical protein
MDHPQREKYSDMSNFNFTGPYEPYRDHTGRPDSAGSNEHQRLVRNDYGVAHERSSSPDSQRSRSSIEGRKPTTAGFGMAY